MKSIFNRVRCSKGNSEVKTRIEIYAKKSLKHARMMKSLLYIKTLINFYFGGSRDSLNGILFCVFWSHIGRFSH